jgi:aryl-alcohol dehydrogenase-like predicted oxidoreductase
MALAWLLQKPGVVAPIVGASKAHHLEQAVAALELRIDANVMARLEEPYVSHSVAGIA